MKSRLLSRVLCGAALCMMLVVASAALVAADRAAAYHQTSMRAQELGRIIASPNGDFVLYEWSRPYDWQPSAAGLSKAAASRSMTSLYAARIPENWYWFDEPTSQYLFPGLPGATYWLGNLSPDGQWVSVYELDRDDKMLKAGIAATMHQMTVYEPPKIIWFDLPPDDARLDRAATWSADGTSLVYPVKDGLARADVATGIAVRCTDCAEPPMVRSAPVPSEVVAKVERDDVPDKAKLVAASTDGGLGVFVTDNADTLSLHFRKAEKTVALFENPRK